MQQYTDFGIKVAIEFYNKIMLNSKIYVIHKKAM